MFLEIGKQVLIRMQTNWNIHTLPIKVEIGAAAVENSLEASQKDTHNIAIGSSSSTPRCLPKRPKNRCSSNTLGINVTSCTIHSG